MRSHIAENIRQGGLVYAERGGLLYLCKSLQDFDGKVSEMVEVLPFDAVMSRTHMTVDCRELMLKQNGLVEEKVGVFVGMSFTILILKIWERSTVWEASLKFMGQTAAVME